MCVSICIDCKRGANECEWLFRLHPIPGWKATKVRCGSFVTYDVAECPFFVKNRPYRRVRRTKKELAAAREQTGMGLAATGGIQHGG